MLFKEGGGGSGVGRGGGRGAFVLTSTETRWFTRDGAGDRAVRLIACAEILRSPRDFSGVKLCANATQSFGGG